MRKVSFLIALFVVFLPLSSVIADGSLDWEVNISSRYTWYYNGTYYLLPNIPMTIDIYAANSSDRLVDGFQFTLAVYGTGGLHGVIWNNSGTTPIPPANEPSILFTGGAVAWEYNQLWTPSWDGLLPDSLCHAVWAMPYDGWPPFMEEALVYQLYLTIPTFLYENEFQSSQSQICVNRVINPPLSDCDWIFNLPTTMNTPFCMTVLSTGCGFVSFTSGPDTLIYEPGLPFDAAFEYEEFSCCSPSMILCDFGTSDFTYNDFTCNGTLHWTYDSPADFCNWVGNENRVLINPCGHWGCGFSKSLVLVYPSEPPQITGGCGASYYVAPEIENDYLLYALDPEEVGILNWYVSSTPEPEGTYSISPNGYLSFTPAVNDIDADFTFNLKAKDCGGIIGECDLIVKVRDNPSCGDFDYDSSVNILDIIYLINYKFKHGPPPNPLWIADTEPDETINIMDILALINYKFKQGPEPVCQ